MHKRKLAIVLMLTLGFAAAVDVSLIIALAVGHKPYMGPLTSLTAFIPGVVVAVLAWQGKAPSGCSASR